MEPCLCRSVERLTDDDNGDLHKFMREPTGEQKFMSRRRYAAYGPLSPDWT
jgi:hypothetical protein